MKQDLERLQYILNRLKAEAGDDRSCSTCEVSYSNIAKYVEEAISIVDRLKQTAEISTSAQSESLIGAKADSTSLVLRG